MKILAPLASLLIACLATPAMAAGNGTKLALSVFCPAYQEGLKTVFVKTGEGTYNSIALSTANVVSSGEVLVEDGKISIHGPSVGDNVYPLVATADVSGARQPLLVLVPGKDAGGLAYQAKIVEGDIEQFSPGGFKFVNLSPNRVRVTCGEKVIEIDVGAESFYQPKIPAGESMPVTIDQKTGDDWQLVSSAQWASREDRRTLVCFLLDPVSKRMTVKSVPLRDAVMKLVK